MYCSAHKTSLMMWYGTRCHNMVHLSEKGFDVFLPIKHTVKLKKFHFSLHARMAVYEARLVQTKPNDTTALLKININKILFIIIVVFNRINTRKSLFKGSYWPYLLFYIIYIIEISLYNQ